MVQVPSVNRSFERFQIQKHNRHSEIKIRNIKVQTDKNLLKQRQFVEKHI